jgi:hypothetical protein
MRYPPAVRIFTKRNALVGFLTPKAATRARSRVIGKKRRNGWKLPLLVVLGVLSAGVLAAVVAMMLRRQREPEHLEGYAISGKNEEPIASIAEPEPSPAA